MAQRKTVPADPATGPDGALNPAHRQFQQSVAKPLSEVAELTNLDSGTSYSNDELRDKIIELMGALGAKDA